MTNAGRFESPSTVVEKILECSRSAACVAMVEEGSEVEIRFANNTTTTNGFRRQRRVVVVSMRETEGGMAVGIASRGGAPDLADLVRASEADAAGAPVAEDTFNLVAGAAGGDPGFEMPARMTELSVLEPVTSVLGDHMLQARAAGHILAGFASHRLDSVYLGTSTGTRRCYEQPTGSLEIVARTPDGERSSWAGAGTSWFDDVDLAELHRRVEQRLGWARRHVDLPAGRYEAILPPDCTADLMVTLAFAMSGRDALDGMNAFSGPEGTTKIGQRLSTLPFELRSNPAEPGLECLPFVATSSSSADVSVFDNGLPLHRTSWIAQGELNQLEFHRAGAGRAGFPEAPPIDNLILELPGANSNLDDLINETERGLLLTCLWYIREVDPVTLLQTGLTRDGVYLVENGEVMGAVNNFRFNESPLGVLDRVISAGVTERAFSREWNEWMNRTSMPALRVADFNMSSISPAT